MADQTNNDLTTLTVDLLAAYVSNNSIRSDDLPGLIASTHAALAALDGPATGNSGEAAAEQEFTPAVSARKSLGSPEHIISMIDGKPYKSLKRHLGRYGLTPDEYRARYRLPASYPMVAPAYSERRREVAKRLGLGRKPSSGKGGAASGASGTPARKRARMGSAAGSG